MMGLPFLFIPISTLAFQNISKQNNNKASAIYSLARNLGGTFGISIITTLVTRRQQVHQSYLGEHLTEHDPAVQEKINAMAKTMIDHGISSAGAKEQARGMMYQNLQDQAAFLAYQDAFIFLGYMAFAFVVILWLKLYKKACYFGSI
ncbi:MAG: oxidoreductase [Candidatus Midichloriaceae bacterium]|jgi:DHA2 family multidrug resistance protein|nr:oxidoreductase [Candidatus Midichloriaceae bacterium]